MKKVEYRLNDYVLNEANKVCKVVGTRLKPYDSRKEQTQVLTIAWFEDVDGKVSACVRTADASKVKPWSFTLAVLTAIGFKRATSHTVVYRDYVSKRSIVIDRTDGSVYGFLCSRHVMLDFVHVDAVHELQHVFEVADIEFPNLSGWLLTENAKRKPPVKLNEL